MKYIAHNQSASLSFTTEDCKVVSGCEGMSWAIGKDISVVLDWLRGKYFVSIVDANGKKLLFC